MQSIENWFEFVDEECVFINPPLLNGSVVALVVWEAVKIWQILTSAFFYMLAKGYFLVLAINCHLLCLASLADVIFMTTFACYYIYQIL